MRQGHCVVAASFVCMSAYSASVCCQGGASTEFIEALPEQLLYLYSSGADNAGLDGLNQLVAGARRWEAGRVLKVCMFGGNEVVGALIQQAASEWNAFSSVKLDFGPPQGNNCLSPNTGFFQVRIGFGSRGFWSALGTDSERRFDVSAPSMNFESFNLTYSAPRMSPGNVLSLAAPEHISAIKHEFGHALGLLHEHQNPALKCQEEIKWTGPGNVYEYFGRPPNVWTPDQVQRKLSFIAQTDPDFIAGEPDPASIMMYALPAAILKSGVDSPCYAPGRHVISDKDKRIIALVYPSQSSVTKELDIKTATIRPLTIAAAPSEVSDLKTRVLADLDSDDTFVRRDARARLADMLGKLPPTQASALIREADARSYRVQLGIAVAVTNASPDFRLSRDAKAALTNQWKVAKDPTLKKQLDIAQRRELLANPSKAIAF